MSKNEKISDKVETTPIFFPELGISCNVNVSKLQEARSQDRRGYATFNGVDSTGEEICIAGSEGNSVPVSILLNDTTRKSKGSKKTVRKMLGAKPAETTEAK